MKKPKFEKGDLVNVKNVGLGVVKDMYECRGKWRYAVDRENTTTCVFENMIQPVSDCLEDGADIEEQYAKQVENEHEQKNDKVNHPAHYTAGKVECIDALESATVNLTGIEAVCTANAIKYLWRWKRKNGVEDLQKAKWYIERLIENANND